MAISGGSLLKFLANPSLEKELGFDEKMVAAMQALADKGAAAAISVWEGSGPHPYETGDYVSGISAEAGIENGVAIGRINAYDWKSGFIEFGTSDTPTFAPLRRGADEAGLNVTEVQRG